MAHERMGLFRSFACLIEFTFRFKVFFSRILFLKKHLYAIQAKNAPKHNAFAEKLIFIQCKVIGRIPQKVKTTENLNVFIRFVIMKRQLKIIAH